MSVSLKFYLSIIAEIAAVFVITACSTLPEPSSPLPLGLAASAPAGYVVLCQRDGSQCPETGTGPSPAVIPASFDLPQPDLSLTPERWALLNTVNTKVNTTVRYVSDEEQFGQPDVWVPAISEGDCEDYALAKRQLLWAAGWPKEDLSLALVESPRTGSHAVLVAFTAQGAYVLDNSIGWILPWNETDYKWLIAQDGNGQWRMAGANAEAVLLVARASQRRIMISSTVRPFAAPDPVSGRQIPDSTPVEPSGR